MGVERLCCGGAPTMFHEEEDIGQLALAYEVLCQRHSFLQVDDHCQKTVSTWLLSNVLRYSRSLTVPTS